MSLDESCPTAALFCYCGSSIYILKWKFSFSCPLLLLWCLYPCPLGVRASAPIMSLSAPSPLPEKKSTDKHPPLTLLRDEPFHLISNLIHFYPIWFGPDPSNKAFLFRKFWPINLSPAIFLVSFVCVSEAAFFFFLSGKAAAPTQPPFSRLLPYVDWGFSFPWSIVPAPADLLMFKSRNAHTNFRPYKVQEIVLKTCILI